MNHLEREFLTMSKMVGIYCRAHHGAGGALCVDCGRFLDYAEVRLDKCTYGKNKPTCANCPIHCYKPAQRELARQIMRFAGPRMLFRHPLLTVAHYIDGRRRARHPRELSREERLRRQP
ncbi:MAG TPA: nitrous oxide-stimulated promoter family protein [Woeseiaceae bacterium]|nr:nitrous oxide-stimulated promoter family protein [Woeseiaceae bacterium]